MEVVSVGVKSVEITRNTESEGDLLEQDWRWDAKAWGANRIRYPGSPRPKRWMLVGGVLATSVMQLTH